MRNVNYQMMKANMPMNDGQLYNAAPSIFANQPWHAMSAKYAFIPTIEVVNAMRREGFQPYSALQSRTRIAGKGEFTKHVIRFRDVRNGDGPMVRALGELYPELILTNSHDGLSAYSIDAGLFRKICTNGLTVCEGNYGQIRARHSGDVSDVIEASYKVVEDFPKVLESVESFSQLRLTAPMQEAFAKEAISLRYEDGAAPVTPQQVITPKRTADSDPTLWNTLNTVQEHLVNGGQRGQNPTTGRRAKTRAVNGLSENSRLNKALWRLAEEMRSLLN